MLLFNATTPIQWVGWALVFLGLIITNEIERRSKIGGLIFFVGLPILMTIYCVAIGIGRVIESMGELSDVVSFRTR